MIIQRLPDPILTTFPTGWGEKQQPQLGGGREGRPGVRGPGRGHRQAEMHHESQCEPEQATFPSGSTEAPLASFLVKQGFCPVTQQAPLGIYAREVRALVHQKTGKSEGSAAFFRASKLEMRQKSIHREKTNTLWYAHTVEYNTAMKRDKLLIPAISQTNLTEFMLRKGSQKKQPD